MKPRKKMIGVWAGAVVLAVAASVAATQPAQAVNPDGSFQLVAATGKCVEVIPDANGNFYIAGNRIQQRTCDGSPQQQWFLQQLPGDFQGVRGFPRYHIVNRMTLQCLDDMNGATNNRNPVQQWTCNATSNTMVWTTFEAGPLGDQIYNERASKCLDVTDGSLQDGARLQIYNCFDTDGNIAQHYTMRLRKGPSGWEGQRDVDQAAQSVQRVGHLQADVAAVLGTSRAPLILNGSVRSRAPGGSSPGTSWPWRWASPGTRPTRC